MASTRVGSDSPRRMRSQTAEPTAFSSKKSPFALFMSTAPLSIVFATIMGLTFTVSRRVAGMELPRLSRRRAECQGGFYEGLYRMLRCEVHESPCYRSTWG